MTSRRPEHPLGLAHPASLIVAADGMLSFTSYEGDAIGRCTPGEEATILTLRRGAAPYGIAAGQDGAIWFTPTARSGSSRSAPAASVASP
jgi:virginiamycin B lyase